MPKKIFTILPPRLFCFCQDLKKSFAEPKLCIFTVDSCCVDMYSIKHQDLVHDTVTNKIKISKSKFTINGARPLPGPI